MTERERFSAVMDYQPFDRVPVLYFGIWGETWPLWKAQGISAWNAIPRETGMDEDWEEGSWGCQGLVDNRPRALCEATVLEETATYKIARTNMGRFLNIARMGRAFRSIWKKRSNRHGKAGKISKNVWMERRRIGRRQIGKRNWQPSMRANARHPSSQEAFSAGRGNGWASNNGRSWLMTIRPCMKISLRR